MANKVKLKDIAELNSRNLGRDYPYDDIEYIDISSVGSGVLFDTKTYALREAPSRAKRLVKKGDTILSTVRPNRRSFLFIKAPKENQVVSTGFAVLTPKEDVNPRYLYYSITNQSFTNYLTANAKGAAYPAVDTEVLNRAEFEIPPKMSQDKIAYVLSCYDNLIENNNKRIKILEEMAQLIYEEWFVKFKFPGHEKVKMVDSELGKIPEGWEVKNLFDISEVTYGHPFKSNKFTEEPRGMPVIRIRDITNGISKTFTDEETDDKYFVIDGDILVGMDGDFHMCRWAGGKSYLNQRVARFQPQEGISAYFLFWALKKDIDYFDKTIVGTTVAHLGDKHLKTIKILVPDDKVMKEAGNVFKPLYDLGINLFRKNQVLKNSRDMLLPRLISGKLDIEDVDIDVEKMNDKELF